MLATVGTWVKSLLVVALLGNVVELVLPDGSFRRYAGLIVGLVLLAAILAPLRSFLTGSTPIPQINWQNPAGAASYHQLLNGEEVRSVEAVLDSYPGVTRVQLVLNGSQAEVTVWAEHPLGHNFTTYARGALQTMVSASVQVQIRVITASALSPPTPAASE